MNDKKSIERNNRYSLTLLFSGIVLILLIATAVIVTGVIILFVYTGVLQFDESNFNPGSYILFILLFSLVIGAAISFLLSKIPLKPVNKILNAMNRLASGDYSARLSFKSPISKHPTIAEMTDSFNTMAAELQKTEVLNSDFINNFSHEFKTPIVSIAGFAKLLKRNDLSDEDRKEYLDIIEEESLRLSQMTTNVLNLTKIENQNALTVLNTYNVSEQLRTCVLMLERKWSKKNIEICIDIDEYNVRANEELLKQVWINLLDNAIKFCRGSSTVTVNVDKSDYFFEVSIENESEPLGEEQLGRIFDKFYQADESHSTEGSGIGLAIVKKIVSLHNGKVNAKCENGKMTVSVKIPQ